MIKPGPDDATTLVSSYGYPLFKGFGLGMNSGCTAGNFPIPTDISGDQLAYTTYTEPVKIELTHVLGIRADMGFQLKFPILTIFASYGLAERYSLVNAGIGIGI